jgi:hypothetical protein
MIEIGEPDKDISWTKIWSNVSGDMKTLRGEDDLRTSMADAILV